MSRTVYVGNLPNFATEPALAARFAEYGEVISVKLLTDRANGRSLGSAYVVMATDEGAVHMIGQMNGEQYGGRQLTVTTATENRQEFGRCRQAGGWKRNPAEGESQSVPSRFRRRSVLP
jgi:RNA recognition motif-containing protein